MASTLSDTRLPPAVRKQLDRLRTDGATPEAMLVEYLAITGLEESLPHSMSTDACRDFNKGNRVLRTCPPPTLVDAFGKRRPTHIPARVSEAFGMHLRASLGAFARQFWGRIFREIEAPERASRELADAVRAHPFDGRAADGNN